MKNTIVDFVVDNLRLVAYAAYIAVLAIGVLAVFGHYVGWWRAYPIALILVYCRVMLFGMGWIR
ncbi:hypothetical protein C8D87_114112 [Lentzea atacamensis]|uniref:Uncharacterized protein n=1 Tax=Lentzea atacamensis TaxID=531938 RepID=A0ABX9DYC7_9PSEU|nr:hypothetical protein [Lentzea atacamensis]RAS59500.1 hypothetical protein C8D87_114112 [Lentzea atacamensis]